MKRLLTVLAAAVPLAAALCLPAGASAATGTPAARSAHSAPAAAPVSAAPFRCSPASVRQSVSPPAGTRTEVVTAVLRPGGTLTFPAVPPQPAPDPVSGVPAYCEVTVTATHPGEGDHEHLAVWLPATGWNGRFQALGGSAYAAGDYGAGLAAAVKGGYAAATTDAGVSTYIDTSWALDAQGRVNKAPLADFASRSEHDLAVVGRQVTGSVYGHRADYAYFNGCSTGGRQGYMEAQRHPDDYDGIVADAPAINWDEFEVATLWPQVVMRQEHTLPTACEFDAFTAAAVASCDALDGVRDGALADPDRCHFDPRALVGTTIACDGGNVTITAADARVVAKIWQGPTDTRGKRLWPGTPVGADLSALAGSAPGTDGTVVPTPFPVPAQWVSTFVEHDPALDLATLTYSRFAQVFRASQQEYDRVIGTDDPDLSAFRDAGGKLLTYHGTADQYIPTQGTVRYRQRVDHLLGGTKKVDDFYRLFVAPGVTHCGIGGAAPVPTDPLAALTAWVEHGKAPATLPAAITGADGHTVTRDLCRYPLTARPTGHGDPADAAGHRCV